MTVFEQNLVNAKGAISVVSETILTLEEPESPQFLQQMSKAEFQQLKEVVQWCHKVSEQVQALMDEDGTATKIEYYLNEARTGFGRGGTVEEYKQKGLI